MYFTIEHRDSGYRAYARAHGNGEIVFWTESYVRKQTAINAVTMVQAGAASAPVYDRT